MADNEHIHSIPPRPLGPLDPGAPPQSFEAVDRLIALATEKRADRVPETPHAGSTGSELGSQQGAAMVLAPERASSSSSPPAPEPRPTVGETAVRAISRLRPLLPALGGALRLVDHGAVQALSRLLPLLAGGADVPSGAEAAQGRGLAQLEARQRKQQEELDLLASALSTSEQQLAQVRATAVSLEQQYMALAERMNRAQRAIRMMTYALVILVPLVIALIALFYAHLREG